MPFRGARSGSFRWTYAAVRGRDQRSPRFLGSPCARAPLFDPGGPEHTQPRGASVLSSAAIKASTPSTLPFGTQSRGPCTSCVRFTPPVTRRGATLGSGWWLALTGRGSHPWGCNKDFKRSTSFSSSPSLAWRTIARINVTVRLGRRAFGSMACQGGGLSRPAWLQICPQTCEMRDSSGPRVRADAPGRDHLA